VGDGLTQGLDAGRGAVLTRGRRDVNGAGAVEAALDVVLDLGGALAQVGPLLGLLEEAILAGALGTPDDTGRGSGRVETGVGEMALVGGTELAVDLGGCLCVDCQRGLPCAKSR
jgi:hypothetical protein